MKITYVEVGRTISKDYQSKRITLGAEIGARERVDEVVANLEAAVDEFLAGRKQKASALRKLADDVEAGRISVEEVQ